ncbi:hypothetical protein L208DRAFT_1077347, partial [Tricholoma matsutake]
NNKGGHLPDAFMSRHFTKTGERSAKTRQWHMRCNYYPATAPLIEHHDVQCIKHLSDANSCPNVPNDETPGAGPAQKKARGPTGQVVVMKKGKTSGLDAFLDWAMSPDEVDRANIQLLRFLIHANISFQAFESPFFLKWVFGIQPSY